MVGGRTCKARNVRGQPCNATSLRDQDFCFWHAPDRAPEAAEARRLGGLRRRREATLAGAYEFAGLTTTPDLRRLLEIAALDCLGLENSIARARALTAIVQVGARLLEVGELEDRLAALEAAFASRERRLKSDGAV